MAQTQPLRGLLDVVEVAWPAREHLTDMAVTHVVPADVSHPVDVAVGVGLHQGAWAAGAGLRPEVLGVAWLHRKAPGVPVLYQTAPGAGVLFAWVP